MKAYPMFNAADKGRCVLASSFAVLILLGIAMALYAYTNKVSTNDSNPDPKTSELANPNDDAMGCNDLDNSMPRPGDVRFYDANNDLEHSFGFSSGTRTGNELNAQSIKPKHLDSGEQALKQQPHVRKPSVSYPFPEDCVVALLIGPPDVGKSMLINSIANYLAYPLETYPDVLEKSAQVVIPVYKHLIPEGYNEKPSITYADNNRCTNYNYYEDNLADPRANKTECRTHDVRHYTFPCCDTNKKLLLIDTPGIAEDFCRSKDPKESNFKMIGRVLGERGIDRIHFLWIVLPSDELDRKGQVASALKLIKDELFTSASCLDFVKLICTRSRTTGYEFTDTLFLVKNSMQELADRLEIALNLGFFRMNSYGVDNESILRWLFPQMVEGLLPLTLDMHEAAYAQSWNISRKKIDEMIRGMLANPVPYKLPSKWLELDAE